MEIRNQMSALSSRISEVDQDKRRRDRQLVLAAAQRNVKAQLQDIDEQVYANSGRLPPSLMSKLEPKINALAQSRADATISKYPPSHQVDFGGGKFMNRTEVDQIATSRMQPMIDDMHERAEREHERQALLRQDQEDRKSEAAMLKARDKEMKEMYEEHNLENALWVQSAMVIQALRHACDSLDYLRLLTNSSVFVFCAIPATMAMATLSLCFMNPEMFQRNVKIRKAEAASVRSALPFSHPRCCYSH